MLQELGRSDALGTETPAPGDGLEVRLAQFQAHFLEHRLFGHESLFFRHNLVW